jgi:hypothetical protein
MLAFQRLFDNGLETSVQTFVQRSPLYRGWMCEVIRRDAGKWSAVRRLAQSWAIEPEAICAVGDDVSDAPMIAAAGLGVAMSHAPQQVREAAALVLDPDGEALGRLIDSLIIM